MKNIIQFPLSLPQLDYNKKLEQKSKIDLINEVLDWNEELGISDVITDDWKNRGLFLLPTVYRIAETIELKAICKKLFKDLKRSCIE